MQILVTQGSSPTYPASKQPCGPGLSGEGRAPRTRDVTGLEHGKRPPCRRITEATNATRNREIPLIRDSQPARTIDCDLVTRRPPVDAGGRWSSTLRARRTGLVDRQSSS